MNITKLYLRTKNLLVKPNLEFNSISLEYQSIKTINKTVLIPFAVLVSLSALCGSIFTHLRSPIDSFVFVFLNAVIVFLIVFIQSYSSGKLIALLARNLELDTNKASVYALVIYSQVPFYLILSFVKIFPSLIFMIILGLYSGYLLYIGIDSLLKISSVKKMQFMIISLLIMIGLFITLSEFFSMLYTKIINLFSTFAVL